MKIVEIVFLWRLRLIRRLYQSVLEEVSLLVDATVILFVFVIVLIVTVVVYVSVSYYAILLLWRPSLQMMDDERAVYSPCSQSRALALLMVFGG